MAYDETLAGRIRELLAAEKGLTEQRMFGGLAFLIKGNMAVAANGQGGLLVHVAADEGADLVERPGAQPMVMRGRQMNGWVRVDLDVLGTRRQLETWVNRGVAYARSLPAKR